MDMKMIKINDVEYEIIKDEKEAIDKEVLAEKITDYFDDYDYIVGDWAYGKLRLKGFYDSSNKKCKKLNDIAELATYIENNCAYGCRWFQIKKNK
jgi:uncharacterized protein YutD